MVDFIYGHTQFQKEEIAQAENATQKPPNGDVLKWTVLGREREKEFLLIDCALLLVLTQPDVYLTRYKHSLGVCALFIHQHIRCLTHPRD